MQPDDSTVPPPPLRIGLPSRLGEMLIRQGLVSSEEVQAALAEQAAGSEWRLGRLLVRRGALDDRTLVQAIAHQFHVPVVELRLDPPTPDALTRLAPDAARRLHALPLRLDADALVVAVSDPPVRELRVAVERSTGFPVRLVLVAADELAAAIDHCYGDEIDLTDPIPAATAGAPEVAGPPPPAPTAVAPVDGAAAAPVEGAVDSAVPVAAEASVDPAMDAVPVDAPFETPVDDATDLQILVWLLTEAVRRDATAVHLDHSSAGLRVRYRVDGALVPGPSLPETAGTVVCHRLLGAAALDPTDDGLHEGAFDTLVDGRSITCHVTATTTASGTHVVVRTGEATQPGRLEDLRVGPSDAVAVRAILHEGRGAVVVAAPLPAAAAEVVRVLVDETGPDSHVVVTALRRGVPVVDGAVRLGPETGAAEVARVARAFAADLLVTDADDAATRRAAVEAAGERLVILAVVGSDPSDIVAELVTDTDAATVAGAVRAVMVATGGPSGIEVAVNVVSEDVCRAILDLPGH